MSTEPKIKIRPARNSDREEVQDLIFGVLAEYGLKPDLEGIDKDLTDIEGSYAGRGGLFEVVENGEGRLIGTVGLYPLDARTIELRKMYLLKEARGKGLGKTLLRRMVSSAKRKGYDRLTLETASVLIEAIGLYTSFGFTPTEAAHTDRCDQSFFLDLN